MPVSWTDNPIEEIWWQLRYLESSFNVRRLLSGRTKSKRTVIWTEPEALDRRAYEIASCIKQGDEYFQAADHVGLATRPLLLYYGTQALAKALILANDTQVNLGDLNFHGLGTSRATAHKPDQQALKEYDQDMDRWEVELEYAVTNQGVFPHLAQVAGDASPPSREVIRFEELLRILPDLAELYSRHYGKPSHCLCITQKPAVDPSGKFSISFSARHKTDEILQVFPELGKGFECQLVRENPTFLSLTDQQTMPTIGALEHDTFVGEYYVRPHSAGFHSSMTVLYAALFILSNLVRYKPAFWMRVIEGRDVGSASLAETLCNVAKRRLPNDVVDQLWNEPHRYSATAYYAS